MYEYVFRFLVLTFWVLVVFALTNVDGFRHDYLGRGNTPNLDKLATTGLHTKTMRPVFPSKTFPNHYSLVTGLYAESHGIVANVMYDPVFDAYFDISDPDAVQDGRWWGGEPIWVTAEKCGKRSGVMFWPGSEAEIEGFRPSYYEHYGESANKLKGTKRIDAMMAWMDLPDDER